MIEFKKVTKIYSDNTYAARDLSLFVHPGEFVSVVGQSGTGKTTLAKMVIAEERPTRGHVVIGGWDITNIKPSEIPVLRRQVGVVFQDYKLLSKKTVYENIALLWKCAVWNRKKLIPLFPKC